MISKETIISLLLALLLGVAIKAYALQHVDPCDAYLAHQVNAPSTTVVDPQGHPAEISCSNWFLRQPRGVQLAAFADVVLVVIFAVSAAADWKKRRRYE